MKKVIKNILIFTFYFIYEYMFIITLIDTFNINFYKLDLKDRFLFLFFMNIIFILLLMFFYKKEITKDIKDFKKNYKYYFSNYLDIYFLGVILMGASNLILQRITHLEMSGNEESVRELINSFPAYMIFSTCLYAPFVEEIIFRKAIKNIVDKKYLFILISGIIFGTLHISDYTNINEVLMGIPYIIMGIDFAYIYEKTDNIFTTMTFHFCHNLILLLVQFI